MDEPKPKEYYKGQFDTAPLGKLLLDDREDYCTYLSYFTHKMRWNKSKWVTLRGINKARRDSGDY